MTATMTRCAPSFWLFPPLVSPALLIIPLTQWKFFGHFPFILKPLLFFPNFSWFLRLFYDSKIKENFIKIFFIFEICWNYRLVNLFFRPEKLRPSHRIIYSPRVHTGLCTLPTGSTDTTSKTTPTGSLSFPELFRTVLYLISSFNLIFAIEEILANSFLAFKTKLKYETYKDRSVLRLFLSVHH